MRFIPRLAVYELSTLTTELLTLTGAAVKWRHDGAMWTQQSSLEEQSAAGISFRINALSRKGNMGQKACEKPSWC